MLKVHQVCLNNEYCPFPQRKKHCCASLTFLIISFTDLYELAHWSPTGFLVSFFSGRAPADGKTFRVPSISMILFSKSSKGHNCATTRANVRRRRLLVVWIGFVEITMLHNRQKCQCQSHFFTQSSTLQWK